MLHRTVQNSETIFYVFISQPKKPFVSYSFFSTRRNK